MVFERFFCGRADYQSGEIFNLKQGPDLRNYLFNEKGKKGKWTFSP